MMLNQKGGEIENGILRQIYLIVKIQFYIQKGSGLFNNGTSQPILSTVYITIQSKQFLIHKSLQLLHCNFYKVFLLGITYKTQTVKSSANDS